MIRKVRYLIFLRDVFYLSISTFGGAQSHLAYFLERLVHTHKYLTEEELLELSALTAVLPGPASTQILTSLGYKIGGPNLAYLTLLVWMLPNVLLMTLLGILMNYAAAFTIDLSFTRFIQPMAVGFVSYAAVLIITKLVRTHDAVAILMAATIITYTVSSPFIFPILLLVAGSFTAIKWKQHEVEEKEGFSLQWANLWLWGAVFVVAAVLGAVFQWRGILIFENFYRNGSLVFGGGQVLIPLIYTEFVEYKNYLSSEEFLIGFGLAQGFPGPTFGFSAYIGAMSLRELGIGGQIGGGLLAAAGIFLPGTFLIFFAIRIWDQLKKYRIVKASLEGINAASAGMVAATAFILFDPIETNALNVFVIVATFSTLYFTKVPAPFIMLTVLALGFIASWLQF
jgi:chromate transporter